MRLKYRADHELARLKHGNRLVRMLLTEKLIPYSLRILVSDYPLQPATSVRRMQRIRSYQKCGVWKEKGHLSCVCDKRVNQAAEPNTQEDQGVEAIPLAKTSMIMMQLTEFEMASTGEISSCSK